MHDGSEQFNVPQVHAMTAQQTAAVSRAQLKIIPKTRSLKDKKIHSLRVLIIGVEHQQTAAVSRAQLKISYPDSKQKVIEKQTDSFFWSIDYN